MRKQFLPALVLLLTPSQIGCDIWDWLHKTIAQPIQQHIFKPVQQALAPQAIAHATDQAQKALAQANLALESSRKDAIEKLKTTPNTLSEVSAALHSSASQLGSAPSQLATIPRSLDQTHSDLLAQQSDLSERIKTTIEQQNEVASMKNSLETMDIPILGVKPNISAGLSHLATSLNLLYGSLSSLQARLTILLSSDFPTSLQNIKSEIGKLNTAAPQAQKNLDDFASDVDNLAQALSPLVGLAHGPESFSFVKAPPTPSIPFPAASASLERSHTIITTRLSASSKQTISSQKAQPLLMPLEAKPQNPNGKSGEIWRNRAQLHSTVGRVQNLKNSLISMHTTFQDSVINESIALINTIINPKKQAINTAQKYIDVAQDQINKIQMVETIISPLVLATGVSLEFLIRDLEKKISPIKTSLNSIETILNSTSSTLMLLISTFSPTTQSFDPISAPIYTSIEKALTNLIMAENLLAQTQKKLEYLGL